MTTTGTNNEAAKGAAMTTTTTIISSITRKAARAKARAQGRDEAEVLRELVERDRMLNLGYYTDPRGRWVKGAAR